uniref:histidine kinase n=1 Tax=Magnetococcus massalia (strain MO-1) TaxID=451514 RepID=A0A1S7LH89_MAGMO|nr:Putative Two-component hybrid sensor and regulator [Candidatus Magnetococcus massalia]
MALWLLLSPTPSWAAPGTTQQTFRIPYQFDQLSIDHGLSHTVVHTLLRDRQGFMWFGTEDGLNRYDGQQFTIFRHQRGRPGSLSDNAVVQLLQDRKGRLWVATRQGGLNLYDPTTESFRTFRYPTDKAVEGESDYLSTGALVEDRKGYIWIGTQGGGLIRMDGDSFAMQRYQHLPEDIHTLASNVVNALLPMRNGTIWVGSDEGLDLLDPEKGVIAHYHHDANDPTSLPHDTIWHIQHKANHYGQIWVATASGLGLLDPDTKRFTNHLQSSELTTLQESIGIYSVLEDPRGNLWLGTNQSGLNSYKPSSAQRIAHSSESSLTNSISNNTIRALFQDDSGLIWAATWGGGVNVFNPFTQPIQRISNELLGGFQPFALYRNPQSDDIWVGTLGGGLLHLKKDFSGIQITRYQHDPRDPSSLSSNRVSAIHQDATGKLWVATFGGGLNRLDRKRGTFTRFRYNPLDIHSLSSDRIRTLASQPDGTLWVGTTDRGLNRWDPEKQQFERLHAHSGLSGSLPSEHIWTLWVDRRNTLWVGTDKGLSQRIDGQKQFKHYTHSAAPLGLPSNLVTQIYEDSWGYLWVATANGLAKMDPKSASFTHFTKAHGLPHNRVNSMVEDTLGQLWLATAKGLSRYDPRRNGIRNFTDNRYAQGTFRHGAAAVGPDGSLYFGTAKGIVTFTHQEFDGDQVAPEIALTRLKIFDHAVAIGPRSPLQKQLNSVDSLTLTWRDKVIDIGFVALSYTHPEKNRYSYRLQGLDKQWNSASAPPYSARYTNLTPGRYTLHIRAANSFGVWNDAGRSLEITVLPPWWGTLWFRLITVVVVINVIFFGYRFRLRTINRQRLQLEAMVTERTLQLSQSQERLAKAQAIAHLGNWECSAALEEMDWSDEIFRIFGYEPQSFKPTYGHYMQMAHPDDRRLVSQAMARSLAHPNEPYHVERRVLRKDGQEVVVLELGEVERNTSGRPVRIVGTLQNITERKAYENAVRKAHEQAEKANHAKTLFLSNMSHEIRTPLNVIIGMGELLLESEQDPQKRNYLEVSHSAGEGLLLLINDILDLSKVESGSWELAEEPLQIHEIIYTVHRIFVHAEQHKQIDLVVDIDREIPLWSLGDSNRLRQILINLVGNAYKFTEQGKITLSAKSVRPGYYRFAVEDTGIGIPQEKLQDLFKPFSQVDNSNTRKYGGTGLGLTICRRLLQKMGGTISVKSSLGQGSCFYFDLSLEPCKAPKEKEPPHPSQTANVEASAKGLQILVAEDSEDNITLLKAYTKRTPHQLTIAYDGREAVEAFQQGQFHLVLMDVQMPNMDGYAATRAIRNWERQQGRAATPVYALSAHAFSEAHIHSAEAGCNGHLTKPIKKQDLLAFFDELALNTLSSPDIS